MGKTNFVFTPGKLSIIMDAQAGSSGKGVIGSYVAEHADNWTFACNTFMPQAGHWVKLDDGRQFFYQTLNSCAYQHEKYEKLYIGPGATIELAALWREMDENGVPAKKLGISPITSILQDIDGGYEKGLCDFDGNSYSGLDPLYNTQDIHDEKLTSNGKMVTTYLAKRGDVVPGTVVLTVKSAQLGQIVSQIGFGADGNPTNVAGVFDSGPGLLTGFLDYATGQISTEFQNLPEDAIYSVSYEYKITDKKRAGGPLAATGSTAHGCGANRARRVLRRKEAKYAKDIPELRPFLCDVPNEVMDRLDRGESGLLEIAQGFQLSYMLQNMFPFTTSRNCTVAAGLDDMMVAPKYAGNVILNFRTFPIRINSNKYIDKKTSEHLTWEQYQTAHKAAVQRASEKLFVEGSGHNPNNFPGFLDEVERQKEQDVTIVKGNSGPGYHDQEETTWEEVTKSSGATEPIMEITSVTKLPRRVFTYSRHNMHEAIRHNTANGKVWISINFMNYVDDNMTGRRGTAKNIIDDNISMKSRRWLLDNLEPYIGMLRFIGTGAKTDDKIDVGDSSDILPPSGIAHKPEKQ